MNALAAPERLGGRHQARALTAQLPEDLSSEVVTLDCRSVVVGTPSYIDELVKVVLVERRARELVVVNAPAEVADRMVHSAGARGVLDRLSI